MSEEVDHRDIVGDERGAQMGQRSSVVRRGHALAAQRTRRS